MSFSLDLPVRAEWPNVERARAAVEASVLAATGDADLARAAALAAGELGENAVKYGRWPEDPASFQLRVSIDGRGLHVVVESPIAAGEDPAALLEMLRWIAGFPSAAEAYAARIHEIEAAGAAGGSRLGLLRVAHEAGLTLRAEVDGEVLRVRADS
jgi:hypothetical protein